MSELVRSAVWRIRPKDAYLVTAVIVMAATREFAKSYAQPILGGDPDNYEVEPITEIGEPVSFLLFT